MKSRTMFGILAAVVLLAASSSGLAANVYTVGADSSGQLGVGAGASTGAPSLMANIVSASGGYRHTLVALSDGTVWAWGYNCHGELGDGTTTDRGSPVQVSGLTGVVAVAAGGYTNGAHSLALKYDGTVWAWGFNYSGQLGDGTTTERHTPVQVSGLTGVVVIAAGGRHSLALKSDGTAWAWGFNLNGQLGDNRAEFVSSVPVQVSELTDVVAIAGGYLFSLAVTLDGTAWAWGDNTWGQLGDGTFNQRWTPTQVYGLTDVTAIAAGFRHGLAVKADGRVWGWGYNEGGELGDGTAGYTDCRVRPVQVLEMTGAVAVAANDTCSVALKSDGTIWTWGNPIYSQWLDGGIVSVPQRPAQVSGPTGATLVAAGVLHWLALQSDGTVWTWGSNSNGQLGDAVPAPAVRATAVQGAALTGVAVVSAGSYYNLAVKAGGTVWGWGNNSYSQLGDGTDLTPATAVQVSGLTDVVTVAAGYSHSLAVKSDGTVWGWGCNGGRALGIARTWALDTETTPIQVPGLTDVVAVAAAGPTLYSYSLALKSDGTVWLWGGGWYTPYQMPTLTDIVGIALGPEHALALDADGVVWAWGSNSYGQLGDGTRTDTSTPVQVSNLTDVVAVAAGWSHSLAVKSDGTARAWGRNTNGQLGDGTTTDRHSPVQVSGLTGAVAIAAGAFHSQALKSDGTVRAWGNNSSGQLGDGTTTQRNSPVQVSGLSDVTMMAGGWLHSLFLAGTGPAATPVVTGVWPTSGSTNATVQNIVVGFDRAVVNVSADDLVLSTGSVVSVEGGGKGPYAFAVTGLPNTDTVTATLNGNIASAEGVDLAQYQWTFDTHILGDIDGDGHVDVVDLLYMMASYGLSLGDPGYDPRCDLNYDLTVNILDLEIMLLNWGA